MGKRRAFFGGGFNPPHIAHVMGVHYAQVMGGFDMIHVLPCWQHAFAKNSELVAWEHRDQMCLRAFRGMKNVEVDATESSLKTHYTYELMDYMKDAYPKDELFLIIGSDNLQVMHSWHRWQELGALVEFFVMPRPGSSELPFSLPDISSTEIREAFARRDFESARTMVPPAVFDYILEHDLYGSGPR